MADDANNPLEMLSVEEQERMEAKLRASARSGACPAPELLFAAQEDVLPETEGRAIREHAEKCSLCQTLLTELHAGDARLTPGADARIRARIGTLSGRRDPFAASEPARRKGFDWPALAVAVAVLVAAVLGIFGYRHLRSAEMSTPLVAVNQPAAPPIADYPELHQLAPLAPPEDVPALVTRGAANAHGPTVHDLMPPFRAYNRGDFAAAAAAFAPMLQRFPESAIPPLYLGISQLHLGATVDAQHSLEQAYAIAGSPHHAEAAWYLAVADLRLDEPKAAAALLRELCTGHANEHAARACVLAQQIGPA